MSPGFIYVLSLDTLSRRERNHVVRRIERLTYITHDRHTLSHGNELRTGQRIASSRSYKRGGGCSQSMILGEHQVHHVV